MVTGFNPPDTGGGGWLNVVVPASEEAPWRRRRVQISTEHRSIVTVPTPPSCLGRHAREWRWSVTPTRTAFLHINPLAAPEITLLETAPRSSLDYAHQPNSTFGGGIGTGTG